MSKKKIIVTGGLGYIGSHTVVELVKAGFEPIIIDDLSNSQLFIADNIEKITAHKPVLYVIDMCDKKKLDEVFLKEGKIDAIIHFAAFKAVGESVRLPVKYLPAADSRAVHSIPGPWIPPGPDRSHTLYR